MATYNTGVSRSSTTAGADYLIPDAISSDIIQAMPQNSAVMQLAKTVQMSSTTQKMPVADILPQAYWVGSDTGLKQTSSAAWAGVELVAAELAVIVPVPNAYIDDAQVDLWGELKPRLAEAIGRQLDAAALFGVGRPSSWQSTSIYESALAGGNYVLDGATGQADFAQSVANVGGLVAKDGFSVNGFASAPGLQWRLTGLRNTQGSPIYQPDLATGSPSQGSLYGFPLHEVSNGSWVSSEAILLAGDWNYAMLGLRQDITYQMFDQGVISNDSGQVVMNLMQQDSQAMRVVMRVAFATANPVTSLQASSGSRSPFGVVQAAGVGS